jgi:hypothetical protein
MSSKLMLKLLISGVAVAGLTSCGNSNRIAGGANGANSSDVTAVNITLPDRGGLKAQVADIETKMNTYRLVIGSSGGGCSNPTNIDKVDTFSQNPTLTASLQQGCDYVLSLELGNKSSGTIVAPDNSEKTAYEGKVKEYLDNSCKGCHNSSSQGLSDLSNFASVKAASSSIYDRVVVKGNMPKGKVPSAEDKAMITAWKNSGFLEKSEAGPAVPDTTTQRLTQIYYKNNTVQVISKADIQGQATFKVNLKLQLQQAGRDIGLGTSTIQKPDTGGAIPGAKPFTLTGARNIQLANENGTVALNDLVKGKKLIIDVSTTNCGYCITEARSLNNSPSHQSALDDSKCSYVTITSNKNDLSGWNGQFGNTYVGKKSYHLAPAANGQTPSLTDVYRKIFPTSSPGTPTFMVISEDGKVESFADGLSEVIDACK